MLRHLEVISSIVKRGKARLEADSEPRYALEHASEQLAEAAEKTSRAFKAANPIISWDRLRGFRHDVAHPYDVGEEPVTLDQLWRFACDEAPSIYRKLRRPRFAARP